MNELGPRIENLAERAREAHALMSTNYEDHAVINAELLKTLLGHTGLNTTRIYTVPSQANLQDAVESIAIE